jgi:hypothetical protein
VVVVDAPVDVVVVEEVNASVNVEVDVVVVFRAVVVVVVALRRYTFAPSCIFFWWRFSSLPSSPYRTPVG